MSKFPVSFVFFSCALLLALVLQLSEGAPASSQPSAPSPAAPAPPLTLRRSFNAPKESKDVAFVTGRKSLKAIAEDALDGLSVCLGVAVLGAALTLPL
ncbi:hypothetical protein GUITHDRAFT_152058 [Guillardia theta CCMP2712]|uniref:Uncharacterized protein n=1 Tax=Guillardia theta (strain CCMP2712) TaxID=905079 RepID=L1JGR3_GUITC|nr:hypothetical protein GUITHDRAFT_152058 [Guillardia theta CCMP2712]EKX47696.1 hypothetical protein GUITHDRAFT_152058 [Guillardia theta CCMP2712]|eukprot:XP_005834676.1 hypothetical protein GUITHDRAFT_152058 [Guillardia theta CCMP2712]